MSGASNPNHEQTDEQWEVLSTDWWKTVFNNVSWSYPASQGNPSSHPSKRTTLLRISQANTAFKSRIAKYLKGDHIPRTLPEELSSDLAGVKAVEEVLEPYEADAGFSMLDSLFRAMDIGWTPDKFPLSDDESAFQEYRLRWEGDVHTLLGDIFERCHGYDGRILTDLTPEEGEERLKDLSPLWDSCLSQVSVVELHSADLIDLTDSELSADSDPLPMTPKAREYSFSALSPSSIKPLNATASSFIPSPAKFNTFRSPPSSSPSPSPSPPALDIVNFPTLRQTILPQSRKEDHDGKSRWSSKRQNPVLPSFLTEKADSGSRRSKTRQMVDRMRSASDARRPDPDFILMADDRPTTEVSRKPMAEENLGSPKASKKRTRRGRESITTVSTDGASIRSSSAEGSGSNQLLFPSLTPSRPQGTRPPPKHSKRTSSSSIRPPLSIPTPPTPAFSSPAGSVSSFGGPVTPGPFGLPFPPPPHHAFMHMGGGRAPSYPPPFPYPYYSGMPGGGLMPPPTPYGSSYQTPYAPYNAYGKGVITGTSGIRHASW